MTDPPSLIWVGTRAFSILENEIPASELLSAFGYSVGYELETVIGDRVGERFGPGQTIAICDGMRFTIVPSKEAP